MSFGQSLSMIAGEGQYAFDPLGAFESGRQIAYDDKMRKRSLSEMARQDQSRVAMGQALAGNQGAMNSLASLDPQNYMAVSNHQAGQAKAKRELKDSDMDMIAGAVERADTPQKYAQVMDYLAQQGFDIDDDDRDFKHRQALIDMRRGSEGATKAHQFDRNLTIDQQNAETSRINAMKQGQGEGGQRAPNGYRWTQTGDLEPIKGGPQDPTRQMPNRTFRPTVDQGNAAGFYDRMVASEQTLGSPESVGAATDMSEKLKGSVPLVGNYLVSDNYQALDQARRDFINAQLRKESGAVISAEEFSNANKQYFPQPGDSEMVIRQKAQNRSIAINSMRRNGGGLVAEPQQQQQQQQYPGADGITQADQGGGFDSIPQEAMQMLTENPTPEMRQYFDEEYGQGMSGSILGQ